MKIIQLKKTNIKKWSQTYQVTQVIIVFFNSFSPKLQFKNTESNTKSMLEKI